MKRLVVVAGVLCVSLSLSGAGTAARSKASFQLKGEVYAGGFKIEMKTAAGRALRSVKAGTYRIKIEDHATIHDFHLRGPGVNKRTSIRARSETIWTVRLRRGTYTYLCDPHAAVMRGTFRVT